MFVSPYLLPDVIVFTRHPYLYFFNRKARVVGVDQRAPLLPSLGVQAALAVIRDKVAPMTEDRPLSRDIQQVAALIASSALMHAVEAKVGKLD